MIEIKLGRNGTHCKHGHAYTEANTYYGTHGTRICRTCQDGYLKAHRERKRAANPPKRKRGPVQLAFKFPNY